MFLAHHGLPKVAKNCPKKPKVDFHVNYYIGSDNISSDDSGSNNMGKVSLHGGQRSATI